MRLAVAVTADDHAQGPPDAPFVLVQYGDYECPYTRRSLREVDVVRAELGAGLRWVFRNYPLTEIHPHALHASEAAEAAGAQGRFWEMHAVLFEHQKALEDEDLQRYAVEVGLDGDAFAADLAGGVHLDRIRADLDGGVRSGVGGTPTFFVNGLRHDGSYSGSELVSALRATSTG
ncbi:MAG: formate-nitrite transporter family protein [Actinomycetota bacterium]|nr:formate-nitrite transporter family protein [Actinomycetota bacterium]